jgi:hypothetical protein
MTMYFAASNFDVAISRDKRKVRKFAKGFFRFAGVDLQVGVCTSQMLASSQAYKAQFGHCNLYDLDQRLMFRPDFSTVKALCSL